MASASPRGSGTPQREQVTRFQNWVYRDVLPGLRRHGHYRLAGLVIEGEFDDPTTLTWVEVSALMRQRYGLHYTPAQLCRILRTHGVLRQDGAPRKQHQHMFWFTDGAWTVHPHHLRELAQRVVDGTRELREFRFIQARLELEGVGSPALGTK